jgi:hypothetical protein
MEIENGEKVAGKKIEFIILIDDDEQYRRR